MSNTIAIRADQMVVNQEYYNQINSEDILAVWNSYKALNNLGNMDSETERNIITLLKVNNLNPFKREAYIIPFGTGYTVVVAYQTLLKRVYESGYNIDNLYFKEARVKSFSLNEQGKPVEIDDIECTAYIKTVEGKTYSFSIMLSEYIGTFYNRKRGVMEVSKMWREKPIFMLRKCAVSCLCRTLPNSGLGSLPYIKEELEGGGSYSSRVAVKPYLAHNKGSKYYCYESLLKFSFKILDIGDDLVSSRPFNSRLEIDTLLDSLNEGDDRLLEYFNANEELKSIDYWTGLIRVYLASSDKSLYEIEQFDLLLEENTALYGGSPLKLFGCLREDARFEFLFE